jgi:hypothetical protein
MFEEICGQLITIEEMLKSEKGYDFVQVRSLQVRSADIYLDFDASDIFQENIASEHCVAQFSSSGISAEGLNELYAKLYALPGRSQRELEVLSRLLTGITRMKDQLQSVMVKKMLLPLLEQRNELRKLLTSKN